jgi:hypothetical protein
MTRRERLERIATAERDRRAGRVGLAIAALGEASEWPARAVLALARLPEAEASETRRILEEGLDRWAEEAGLGLLDASPSQEIEASSPACEAPAPTLASAATELTRPIDHGELERAFAEAEAQTDEMHGANDVAERVLMQEPLGLAELGGDAVELAEGDARDAVELAEGDARDAIELAESDARDAIEFAHANDGDVNAPIDAASAPRADPDADRAPVDGPSRAVALATLERWLRNLEGRHAGRGG